MTSDAVAETRATYDVIAAEFARRTARFDNFGDDMAWLRASLPDGGWVADIGCGPGNELRAFRAAGIAAIGLDLSDSQLRASGLPDVVQADMRFLPLRTSSVDGIWCVAALLHLPRVIAPEALAEFARVLRPGGAICLVVAEGDHEGFEETVQYGLPLRRWFTYHQEEPLQAMLAAVGFTVVGVRRETLGRHWMRIRAKWNS